jgi:hypothetical protein
MCVCLIVSILYMEVLKYIGVFIPVCEHRSSCVVFAPFVRVEVHLVPPPAFWLGQLEATAM